MSSGLAADDLLQQRQQIVHRARSCPVDQQDVGVLEDGLHALGVGHEVGREVALVELHALGELELGAEGVGLLDGDDAVLADLVERVGDQLADLGVLRGDGGDLAISPSLDRAGVRPAAVDDGLDGLVDAALEADRVRAGGDVAQALVHQRLGQDRRGRRAVTGDVVGLGGDLLGELGAEVLVGVSSSTSLAMVTPSLVMVGAPHFLSMTTLRPLGPSVTLTALARASTPRSSARGPPRRTSKPYPLPSMVRGGHLVTTARMSRAFSSRYSAGRRT
jgi:hypothetical protein